MLCPAPDLQSGYRQAGRPLNLPPPQSGPAFLLPASVILGRTELRVDGVLTARFKTSNAVEFGDEER